MRSLCGGPAQRRFSKTFQNISAPVTTKNNGERLGARRNTFIFQINVQKRKCVACPSLTWQGDYVTANECQLEVAYSPHTTFCVNWHQQHNIGCFLKCKPSNQCLVESLSDVGKIIGFALFFPPPHSKRGLTVHIGGIHGKQNWNKLQLLLGSVQEAQLQEARVWRQNFLSGNHTMVVVVPEFY